MGDFNFNLDNEIPYKLKESYLPVRLMTSSIRDMGEVVIVGCNPERTEKLVGSFSSTYFDFTENENTEYFVFPASSNLYPLLRNKISSMDAWCPDVNYHTIIGFIFGKQHIIHIDDIWYKGL